MKFRRKPRDTVEIGLAPLIDVVFILLLFFVVTTTFTRETQLKIDLPEATAGAVTNEEENSLELVIDVSGQYALNGQSLVSNDRDTLQKALNKESEGDTSILLIISADANTPHQSVVTAMDAAGELGFAHMRISTVEATAAP